MKFLTLAGREQSVKNQTKYLIDWGGKSLSKFQARVKANIRPIWSADLVFEEFPVLGTRMTLDFYNHWKKIAIEVDGDQHLRYNKHFHGGNRMNFLKQLSRDDDKEKYCEVNGIKMIRIYPNDDISTETLKKLINE